MDYPWCQATILLFSFALLHLSTWIIWPSRWNLIVIPNVGFFFVAYFVALLLTDAMKDYLPTDPFADANLLNLFTAIIVVGALFYVLGLIIGSEMPRVGFSQFRVFTLFSDRYVRRRTAQIMLLAIAGLYLSLLLRGDIPAFASDPLQAKYNHGEYRAGYLRSIWLYYPAFSAFVAYAPIMLLTAYRTRRIRYVFLVVVGIAAMALYLQRGAVGVPILLGLATIAAARSRKAVVLFLALSLFVWSFGSVANYLAAAYFDIRTATIKQEVSVWDLISGGAPDVPENLLVLEKFTANPQYTWGRTWVGGLVPLEAQWNQGIWALSVAHESSHDEAIEMPGGGMRLELPILGYTAFGWLGAMAFPMIIGMLSGYVVQFAKRRIRSDTPPEVAAVVAMTAAMLVQFFTIPLWASLTPLIVIFPLIHPIRLSFGLPKRPTPARINWV
jgi:hypothetical protein